FADELRAALAEPGKRVVDVVHSEHDAQVAQCVHRGVPVIGDCGWREESRKLEPTVAVRGDQHGDLDALGPQSGDTPGPLAFDHGSAFEAQPELGEKRDRGIEGFYYDAHVVHPLESHIICSDVDRKRPALPFTRSIATRRTAIDDPAPRHSP